MVAGRREVERVDRIFGALADATRRDIVRRVLDGEWSVSALAREYPMSLTAIQKHVVVLERAALVTKKRQGREQRVLPNLATLRHAAQVLEQLELLWRARLDRFAAVLAEPP